MGTQIEDKYIQLRHGGHECHVGYSGTSRMRQSGHVGRECLETGARLMAGMVFVRLPLTLGRLILHGEGG